MVPNRVCFDITSIPKDSKVDAPVKSFISAFQPKNVLEKPGGNSTTDSISNSGDSNQCSMLSTSLTTSYNPRRISYDLCQRDLHYKTNERIR